MLGLKYHRIPETIGVTCRYMTPRDYRDVAAIDAVSFGNPWGVDGLKSRLARRGWLGMVAECGDEPVGYAIYSLHERHVELHRIAVRPHYRRMWAGDQMISRLIGKLSRGKRERLELIVHERDLDACLFFRACGFLAIQTLPGYYPATGDDAYVLEYEFRPL